jgi:hypothetical protein
VHSTSTVLVITSFSKSRLQTRQWYSKIGIVVTLQFVVIEMSSAPFCALGHDKRRWSHYVYPSHGPWRNCTPDSAALNSNSPRSVEDSILPYRQQVDGRTTPRGPEQRARRVSRTAAQGRRTRGIAAMLRLGERLGITHTTTRSRPVTGNRRDRPIRCANLLWTDLGTHN